MIDDDAENQCYVAEKPCCGRAVCFVSLKDRKDAALAVADWIRRGLAVRLCPVTEARTLPWGCKCAAFPPEEPAAQIEMEIA